MEEFSGATAVSIQQEFYINMLLSNLASLIKNEADEEIQISARSTNKFRYQANRAFIIGRIKSIIPKILCGLFELSIIEVIKVLCAINIFCNHIGNKCRQRCSLRFYKNKWQSFIQRWKKKQVKALQ